MRDLVAILVLLFVLAHAASGLFVSLNRAGLVRPRMSNRFQSFAVSTGAFIRDCDKIIEASKTGNRVTIHKILLKYSRLVEQDSFEILRMHSLINAARVNDLAVAEDMVEKFGANPLAYNGIAIKEAIRTQSQDVLTYLQEKSDSTLIE